MSKPKKDKNLQNKFMYFIYRVSKLRPLKYLGNVNFNVDYIFIIKNKYDMLYVYLILLMKN